MFLPSIGWETGDQDNQSITYGNRGLERVVGGLELSAKFAHHEDLDKVIHAGRGVGWSPDFEVEHRDWESAGEKFQKIFSKNTDWCQKVQSFCQYPVGL